MMRFSIPYIAFKVDYLKKFLRIIKIYTKIIHSEKYIILREISIVFKMSLFFFKHKQTHPALPGPGTVTLNILKIILPFPGMTLNAYRMSQ